MSRPKYCVVLDLDDTLFLERDYVRSGFYAVSDYVAEVLGVEDFGTRAWAAFERGLRGKLFNVVLDELGFREEPDLIATLVDIYRTHEAQIRLLPDGRRFLESLRPDVFVGVITDGPLASQQAKAVATNADSWSHRTIFTASLGPGRGKPDPTAFRLIEECSDCRAGQCWYIADNPTKDFIAPRALGWRTVRVRRPRSLHASLPSTKDVDHEVASLDQLLIPYGPMSDILR